MEDLEKPTADENAPTTVIGPFRDARWHRNGVSSAVYKASAAPLGSKAQGDTTVALKVTTPSTQVQPHNSAREVRILLTTNETKTPSIIPLLDAFTSPGGQLTLVFPFMPYDLDTLLHHHPSSLTPTLKHKVLTSLFSALTILHSQSIIHRDIKPSNILLKTLTGDGPIHLSDFGITWSPNDPDSEFPSTKITDVGTTCYRPPELLFGHTSYDTTLDIWSAGCLVAELEHPEHKTLFHAGPMGSELGLIKSIFETLGTPDEEIWPSATGFPDWGKMSFYNYPPQTWSEILPNVDSKAIDLISKLVRYEMPSRLSAKEALEILEKW